MCLTPKEDHRFDTEPFGFEGEFDLFAENKPERDCDVASPVSRFGIEDPRFMNVMTERTVADLLAGVFAPHIKLIVLLREPVQRYYSAHKMMGLHKPFLDYVKGELREWHAAGEPRFGLKVNRITRGFYDCQLERLESFFGAGHAQITISERVFANSTSRDREYNRILGFIGVSAVSTFASVDVFERRSHDTEFPLTTHGARLLRGVYHTDTRSLYARPGFVVEEWESWYEEHAPLEAGVPPAPKGACLRRSR